MDRLTKFLLALVLAPFLCCMMLFLAVMMLLLPVVVLIRPDIIKVGK